MSTRTIDPPIGDGPDAISRSRSTEAAVTAVNTLLTTRAPDATICPSAVARRVAGTEGDWRGAMKEVHQAVDEMHRKGAVRLSLKGKGLVTRTGPYRIARP